MKLEKARCRTSYRFRLSFNVLEFKQSQKKKMRPDLITDLYEKEATYWWNVSKREMVLSLLRSVGGLKEPGLALDIGCGGGYTAWVFESYHKMVGVDVSAEALKLCLRRGLRRLCQVDLANFLLPFKSDSFDVVLALDVIEHLDDDLGALMECRRILKPGGVLILTVPAFMWLWSPWDEALGHKRRYTALSLSKTIQEAGLSMKELTYMFFFVFPMAVFIRGMKRLFQKDPMTYSSDFLPIPGVLNNLFIRIGRLEQWIITKFNLDLPFGLSVISVAVKS
jgi:SAM-dependent methyltransferase